MQEFLVKKIDRVEVVCMIGVYGLLVSVVQLYPFLLGDMITFTCNKLYTSLCGMIKFPFAFIPLPSFRSTLELKSLESVKWSTDIVSNLFNLSVFELVNSFHKVYLCFSVQCAFSHFVY